MVNEIRLDQTALAEARRKKGYTSTVPSVILTQHNINDARNRVAARRDQATVTPEIVIDNNALSRAKREMSFRKAEPTPYRQQYLNTVVLGNSVDSCRIAASIIALVKMGVVRSNTHLLQELETEIVTKGIGTDRYRVDRGRFNTDIEGEIFNNFGLESGRPTDHWYAVQNWNKASLAALKAGGCVIAGVNNHTYCITDISADEKSIKYFDPLIEFSSTSGLDDFLGRVQHVEAGNPDLVAVYPKGYQREMSRNEGVFDSKLNDPITINTGKYLISQNL